MKAVFVALLTLAASAFASPVMERQVDTQQAKIEALTTTIRGFTANINKTVTAVPDMPSLAQQNAAAAAIAPDLQGITAALTAATASFSKRDLFSIQTGCCLFDTIKILVFEITCTLKFVILKLGLACVLTYLTPLLVALAGLIKCLDKVVDGLLIAVKLILKDLLGDLAAGVLSLIW